MNPVFKKQKAKLNKAASVRTHMVRVRERIGSKSSLVPPCIPELAEDTKSEMQVFKTRKSNILSQWRTSTLPPGLHASLQKEHPTWGCYLYAS